MSAAKLESKLHLWRDYHLADLGHLHPADGDGRLMHLDLGEHLALDL
jgi:hypothetical protein